MLMQFTMVSTAPLFSAPCHHARQRMLPTVPAPATRAQRDLCFPVNATGWPRCRSRQQTLPMCPALPAALSQPPRLTPLKCRSQAYMLADTFVFLLPFTPGDTLFLGHHSLVVVYTAGCLLLRRGGISVMVLTALGESTSIFQNSWLIARNTRHNSQVRFQVTLRPVYKPPHIW